MKTSDRGRVYWHRYRALKLWLQGAIAAVPIAVLVGAVLLVSGGNDVTANTDGRTVTLATIDSLSGTGSSVTVFGTVRSMTEANLLAQTSGTVRSVHTSIGATIPAGFIIAELENAGERAAVLSAEGSYEAALASRQTTSLPEKQTAARNTYRTAYSNVDTTLRTYVDQFFGAQDTYGPALLLSGTGSAGDRLSRTRADFEIAMLKWRKSVDTAESADPAVLLQEAATTVNAMQLFLSDLAVEANSSGSNATSAQLSALASARAAIDAQAATLSTARDSYRSGSVGATASVDAQVKQALGGLRSAQALLEKTLVRAPLGGTINFLPIRIGDYVTAYTHVATVAQNGALEVVAYVSEDNRALLSPGTKVTVEGTAEGVITAISPALDPVTKQIEVRIAVNGASDLVNGQSVHIALPGSAPVTSEKPTGPIHLPLTAVKLTPSARVIFTIGEDGRLVSHPVEIGEVRGDAIEIMTSLPGDLRIVTDARGLSDGQKVSVATSF